MREHEREFRIRAMCRVLGVGVSAYYAWRSRKPSARATANNRLVEKIKVLHAKSRGIYGSPKIYQQLRRDGEAVNHKRVEKLMKAHAIRAKRVKKFRLTTDSRHTLPVAENVLARRFTAAHPNQVWTTDITYIPTEEGWLYLTVFLDLYSRLVVGWAVSESLTTTMVEHAFVEAHTRRGTAVSPLVHSDRGCQFASTAFRKKLAAWNCSQSMSRKGNCWDNAVTESFFGSLKNELIHHERFRTRQQARDKIFDYIEVFYNRSRIYSAIDYFAPVEYEARYYEAQREAQLKQAA